MVLEYDFDIVAVDPGTGDPDGRPVLRAMFRDVKTADALRATSPKIRKIFQDAGFGLESTESEMIHGLYRSGDEADRLRVLRALFKNVRKLGLRGEYCGEFDLRQFLKDVKTARPHGAQTTKVADWSPNPRYQSPATPQRRALPWRIGVALGLAVVLFAILKYLAASGAAP